MKATQKNNHLCRRIIFPVALVLAFPCQALAAPLSAVYRFKDQDNLGVVLNALGICPLWGPQGNVSRYLQQQPKLKKYPSEHIPVGTPMRVIVDDSLLREKNYQFENGEIFFSQHLNRCKAGFSPPADGPLITQQTTPIPAPTIPATLKPTMPAPEQVVMNSPAPVAEPKAEPKAQGVPMVHDRKPASTSTDVSEDDPIHYQLRLIARPGYLSTAQIVSGVQDSIQVSGYSLLDAEGGLRVVLPE